MNKASARIKHSDASQRVTGLRRRSGVREGAAVIPKGRERVDGILEAAREIIVLEGYSNFTMRKIAAAAGISLGNLQHYFTDKTALLRELLKYLNRRYDEDYAAMESARTGEPAARLYSLVDYLLADIRKPLVRGLFLQFWALSSNDEYISQCMEETYAHYRKALAAAIKAVNPPLDERELRLRSATVQSMIEGSQFSLRHRDGALVPQPGLNERLHDETYRIAKRPAAVRAKA